jgi:hypothetical protein
MYRNQIKNTFSKHPKKLFLLDAFGALLSSFLIGIVLVQYESYFGIPVTTLYLLATLPLFFALFDFYCYFNHSINLKRLLQLIAIANLMYCLLSLSFIFIHRDSITNLAWIYLTLEIGIVVTIARLEFQIAKENN